MNAFLIERLAIELQKQLVGTTLNESFTTSQFDINLVFEFIALKISFFQGQAYFQTPPIDKLQKKNRLSVFKSLVGVAVEEVRPYPYDRRFDIVFDNNEVLVFYLYGKFSQITHYKNGQWQETFPVKSSKIEEIEPYSFSLEDKTVSDLRFLSNSDIETLETQGFDSKTTSEKENLLDAVKNEVNRSKLYLNKGERKYTLDLEKKDKSICSFDNVLEVLDNFSRLYISHQVFKQTKNAHLGQLRKELKALTKKVKSAEKRLNELNRASGYKEKADLIMANMWQIEKGDKEAVLTSFDGEGQVSIKLNATLTPQANAERYYNKGKNESKQRDFAQKHLAKTRQDLTAKELEIEEFEKLESIKEIRKTASNKTTQKEMRLPYKSMQVDGYEIRIGKGAKDNDDLLRYHTTKTDMWLHAKDVSGSHVIIRNPSNATMPMSTIEKVASIAAFYSKSKSESLAAVIYTPRKYVRKPKGATPGLVKVDKEDVVLVEPKQSVNK